MSGDESVRQQILLVDDLPDNLKVLRDILEKSYAVRIAISGTLAINSAREYPPDMILLDIRMPGMNGYEVCRRLKADDVLRDIPVIFISALDAPLDKMKAFESGGVDYIAKPFYEEEVLARVKTHLMLRNLQKELQRKNTELLENNARLQESLDNVKTLRGLLPICANCKKIRDDRGYWNQIEEYFTKHSEIMFSHGICPQCMDLLYRKEDWYQKLKQKQSDLPG